MIKSEKYTTVHHTWKGHDFVLHPLKGMYWRQKKALIVSDLHLGKGQHFRNNGIPVPKKVMDHNFANLDQLLHSFDVEEVYFLGDLFHSRYNSVWETFADWVRSYSVISFNLIPGNHDILDEEAYLKANLKVLETIHTVENIVLSHFPIEDVPDTHLNIFGHIHPAISFRGKARQSIKMPCFLFELNYCIMPAFGAFTGTARVYPTEEAKAFGILEGKILVC